MSRLPDAAARDRIATDLDANLLVEAGAGAGKTTAMVGRMLALVRTGAARVEEVAAVTFTRKAAAELRERFQEALEDAHRQALAGGDDAAAARLDRALRDIDHGFVGTIHSFCARLLREHPLEAGLDPAFREVSGAEEARLRGEAWTRFLERLAAEDDPVLDALADVGLRPGQLQELFEVVSANPDVSFPAEPVARPDPAPVRRALERLLDRAEALMPKEEPEKGWDGLQSLIRTLRFYRWTLGWDADVRFFEALGELLGRSITARSVTQNRWGADKATKAAAKELGRAFEAFAAEDGAARRALERWHAHRYPVALELARRAAAFYERERVRAGRLTFQDLLVRAAALLRASPPARRALAARYRRLLVDEFQDTDPVQAEVLFLLAATDPAEPDWRRVTPRAGALFVVGDPKQSIYRFRRADIAIYNAVKARFEAWGGVLELVANFRSRRPIEAFVNDVFRERFPERATEHQAAFAPLLVQREDGPHQGIFWYDVVPAAGASQAAVAEADAERIASWVAERVGRGERRPGDFLVLAWRKNRLAAYARALEARGIPVQVTGAGVGVEEELTELILLLEALADPDDATRTVAVLLGLFFGLDYDALMDHAEAGASFSFLDEPGAGTTGPVAGALATLRRWWAWTHTEPAEIAIARIVEALGLLPHAAAGELGETRAGALLYALDAVRVAGLDGDTSLASALDALRAALDAEEAEAPLEPGRADVVRVMNLHKAKGLEAPVVVLAYPTGDGERAPDRHFERPVEGGARGWLEVRERRGRNWATLARPLDWPARAGAEAAFAAAEGDRLLYVAATRAGDELIVARCPRTEEKSPWRAFYPALEARWTRLEPELRPRLARPALDRTAAELDREVAEAEGARKAPARRSYAVVPVTSLAEAEPGGGDGGAPPRAAVPAPTERRPERAAAGGALPDAAGRRAEGEDARTTASTRAARGRSWGTAVHRALEAAARGAAGGRLRSACRGFLLDADRPTAPDGEPEELDELVALVEAMRGSAVWERMAAADAALVEVPFALPVHDAAPGDAFPFRDALDDYFRAAPAAAGFGPPPGLRIIDGVIDLVFREADAWVVVDYKSDAVAGAELERRLVRYQRQVDIYAWCWERLTGMPVSERMLVFTAAEGRTFAWSAAGATPREWSPERRRGR